MIAYIFKSSLSLIILFGLYWFLLRKEKLFVFNRFFLVSSVVFSLAVPFISIPVNFQTTPNLENIIPAYNYVIPVINTVNDIIPNEENISQQYIEKQSSVINISGILLALYISGVLLFLIRFLRNIYIIIRRTKSSERTSFKGHRIVLTEEKTDPCCFFSNIYLNRDDYINGRIDKELLDHELEHARQSHTTDIILIELLKIFYWFNPVHLLYDRAIRINHEYLADNGVISGRSDIKSYADKLLRFITCRSNMSLTSGSNHSFTKKRLLMISKTKSNSSVYGLRITITLSLILVFSLFLSFKQSDLLPSNKEGESNELNDVQTQTVKDIDGNVYKTVTIGSHVWMAENLKTTRYNDGTDIPLVTDNEQWQKYEPAYCWYNNNEAENKEEYGALYNWYIVNTNKLCPAGWHVPDKNELISLMNFPPIDTITGGKLKEAGTFHWKIPNKGATNETGFKALPGGFRTMDGKFGYLGECGRWWTSHEENAYVGLGWTLHYNDGRVGPAVPSKRVGYSVRCIKDYSEGSYNSSFNDGVMDQNTVRGTVVTKDGNPLFGATISSTGTDNTSYETIADFDGRFILKNVKSGATLLFEYSGFKSQILKADFGSEMVVKLIRDPDFNGRVFITEVQNVNFRNSDFTPAKALLAINGEIVNYNGNLRVNPGEIKSFKVLKDKEATGKYGDKARDGAVEIILFEEKTGPAIRKQSDKAASDTSKYKTLLRINHTANKGELIDIPVSNLQYVSVWIDNDIDKTYRKGFRSIAFMTRDYFKVKGMVVQENGKPLPGAKISATDNPVTEISDKEGRFEIEDVREGALIEFSLPGYKTYYLSTLYEVAFNLEMTIELIKENIPE